MKVYKISIFAICMLLSVGGAILGRNLITSRINDSEDYVQTYSSHEEEVEDVIEQTIRINWETTIVYKHYDTTTGETTQYMQTAPSFLVSKTEEDLINTFTDWEITSFSNEQVIMQRTITSLPPIAYTLSSVNDFIAIYRGAKNLNDIIEITTIPTSHLPIEDKERLSRGISVLNRNDLIRRLEDFSS